MIRVSIEVPDAYNYRFGPLIENQTTLLSHDVLVGYRLASPDLRILHHDIAIEELQNSADRRLHTPTIVYERVDSAVVLNDARVRGLMQHNDVKLWLKSNTFRDFRKNNENLLTVRQHHMLRTSIANVHAGATSGGSTGLQLTEAMARKIRSLPIAAIDRFAGLRNASVDWSEKRPIDVAFAGSVDYEVRGTDYWDGAFDQAQAASVGGFEEIVGKHRREAIRQLVEMKHLRIVIGMNRAVQPDLYEQVMLRSSITVSPWGFGEYADRDYEAILGGSILVKPYSDHIETFAPDIYQAYKYYVPCAADFSDLHDVIRTIMSDRNRAMEIAKTARDDMLSANREDKISQYFLGLFGEALGISNLQGRRRRPSACTLRPPLIGIAITPPSIVRGTLEADTRTALGKGEQCFVFSDDTTTYDSHDIRLVRNDVWVPGLYRVRCIARRVGRRHIGIRVHQGWTNWVAFGVDLDTGQVARHDDKGSGFSLVQTPRVVFFQEQWFAVSAFVRIDHVMDGELFLMLYAAESNRQFYYTGLGEPCFEIAALDLDVVGEFGDTLRAPPSRRVDPVGRKFRRALQMLAKSFRQV